MRALVVLVVLAGSARADVPRIGRTWTIARPAAAVVAMQPAPAAIPNPFGPAPVGTVRTEQLQILRELIRQTPASEVEERGDYMFRLAELLDRMSQVDPADAQKQADAVQAYEDFLHAPGVAQYPKMDLALAGYASLLERMNRPADARRISARLLKEYPASKYVANAYLAVADDSFTNGNRGDARKGYESVVARFPKSDASWYAMYKLGWVHMGSGAGKEALEAFVAVAGGATGALRTAAIGDAARAYVGVGAPDKAVALFEKLDSARVAELLRVLAMSYRAAGKSKQALAVYGELGRRNLPAEAACLDLVQALQASVEAQSDIASTTAALGHALAGTGVACSTAAEPVVLEAALAVHDAAGRRPDQLAVAVALWDRASAMARPPNRDLAARNRAIALWQLADTGTDAAAWATAAEAMQSAAGDVADAAIDAWENAMRVGGKAMAPALVTRIRDGLAKIPSDRARVLRAGL